MRKPSVLHVYKDYYPPVVGGVEKCINWMCSELRRDYHVRVLVASRTRRTVDELVDGVRVIRVGCWGRLLSLPLAPGFVGWLKRLDSAIVHVHMPMPTAEMACLVARPRGNIVATYHSDIVRRAQRMSGYGVLQQRFLRRVKIIMPTSERYMNTSRTLARHRDRCHVVPLGIPIDDYRQTPETRSYTEEIRGLAADRTAIVFVGVMRYYKGLPFLIEAMHGMGPEACLFLAGEPPEGRVRERQALERQVEVAGLQDRVFFLGRLTDAQIVGLLHAGDLFCLPAHLRGEALGLCQVEAMACGMPVVSTNLDTAVPEVNQNGVTGLVVTPADPVALRRALTELVANPDLRRRMGEAARHRARTVYSARTMAGNLRAVYEQALQMRRR